MFGVGIASGAGTKDWRFVFGTCAFAGRSRTFDGHRDACSQFYEGLSNYIHDEGADSLGGTYTLEDLGHAFINLLSI